MTIIAKCFPCQSTSGYPRTRSCDPLHEYKIDILKVNLLSEFIGEHHKIQTPTLFPGSSCNLDRNGLLLSAASKALPAQVHIVYKWNLTVPVYPSSHGFVLQHQTTLLNSKSSQVRTDFGNDRMEATVD